MEINENKHLNINHGTVKPVQMVNMGWQCPVCRRVLAPWVSECPCRGKGNDDYTITCHHYKNPNKDNLVATEKVIDPLIKEHIPVVPYFSINEDIENMNKKIVESINKGVKSAFKIKPNLSNMPQLKTDLNILQNKYNKEESDKNERS